MRKLVCCLVPLITLYVVFYIGWHVLPEKPFDTWWSPPLAVTLIAAFVASLFTCCIFKDNGDDKEGLL